MKYWIQPANTNKFKVIDLFNSRNIVDWRQFRNFEVGDIVYLYCAKPYSQILYKLEVLAINITNDEMIPDNEFWVNKSDINVSLNHNRYYRLKLLSENTTELLKLDDLCANGLKAAPQGAIIVKEPLLTYISEIL